MLSSVVNSLLRCQRPLPARRSHPRIPNKFFPSKQLRTLAIDVRKALLCFHTVTHSSAKRIPPTLPFSTTSALFRKNGGDPLPSRPARLPSPGESPPRKLFRINTYRNRTLYVLWNQYLRKYTGGGGNHEPKSHHQSSTTHERGTSSRRLPSPHSGFGFLLSSFCLRTSASPFRLLFSGFCLLSGYIYVSQETFQPAPSS